MKANLKPFFDHFAMRLSERYGILITYERYIALCHIKLKDIKEVKSHDNKVSFSGTLTIAGRKVTVLKANWDKNLLSPLLTAWPNDTFKEKERKHRNKKIKEKKREQGKQYFKTMRGGRQKRMQNRRIVE